jgi:hypothetical protein
MSTATAATPACGRCRRRHRSWRAVAQCRWQKALWISGNPPFDGSSCYASVSDCPCFRRVGLTAVLHATRAEAEAAKRLIDKYACGGGCSRQHRVVEVSRDDGRGRA